VRFPFPSVFAVGGSRPLVFHPRECSRPFTARSVKHRRSRTSMYPYVALRGPTYRENSHANHTWHQHSHQTACLKGSEASPVWVRSHRPLHSRQRQATQGYKVGVKTLIRWESLGNRRRGGGGLMASRIPALPRDSHVQSHAALHKNNLCDSHAALVARAIAGGWTRPARAGGERQVCGNPIRYWLLTEGW
jgi:hypothetical protein